MGSIHKASCVCGYEIDVTVGGDMSSYLENEPFPYYCKSCGLVEANTALKNPVCPSCKSTDIHQYGRPPISSIPQTKNWPALQNFNFSADREGNLCPACKAMTLVFSGPIVLFD